MRSQKGDLRKLLRRMHPVFRWIFLVNLCERAMSSFNFDVPLLMVCLDAFRMGDWGLDVTHCSWTMPVCAFPPSRACWVKAEASVFHLWVLWMDHKTSWCVVSVINTKWFFFICSYFGLKSILSDGHTVVSAGFLGLHFLGSAFFQPLLTLRFVFVFKTEDTSCRQHIEVPVCETSLLVCIFWWENWDHQIQSYYWNPCIPSCHLFFL